MTNAQQAVKESNDARAVYKDLSAGYLRAKAERAAKSKAFDETWKAWEADTSNSPELNATMRKAWEEYMVASDRARVSDTDARTKALTDWEVKFETAKRALIAEAGLLNDFREEG